MADPDPESAPDAAPELTARQKRLFAALAALLSLLVALVIAEVAVRLSFRYNTPDTVRANTLQYLPSVFTRTRLAPDQHVVPGAAWGPADGEDEAPGRTITVNEHGFRGPSFAAQKPPGVCRIAVLGGSAVFDVKADEGAEWPRRLEARLRADGHPGAEVINAGVPGHASFDSLGKLYSELWLYEPDVVLLYNGWNDVKHWTTLDRDHPLAELVKPYDPTADPFQSYRGPLDRLLAHSQLYVKLRNRYYLRRIDVGGEGQITGGEFADGYGPWGARQLRLNVELVVAASRAIGALPVLLTQATLVRPDNTPEERQRIAYGYQGLTHDALVRALGDCNRTVREVAAEREVDLVDLAARFSGRAELFVDHVHTTAEGSAALAGAVAEALGPRLAAACAGEAP